MGTGYTRNDTSNNIADGNVINASDLDGEFDAVQAAFNGTTGHSHDGTSGEGPQIAAGGIANNAVALGTKTTGNYVATITAGTGISGSSSSEGGTPTIALATAGAGSGTYGSTSDGTKIDTITLDAYGRVTAVATGATGDIQGVTAGTNLTGGGTSGTVTINMATGSAGAGTYGSTANGTKIDTITIDAYGRVTSVATGATGTSSTSGTVTSVATGTGLTGGTITSTGTISLSHLGFQNLTDPNDDSIAFWDDSAGAFAWLDIGNGLSISGTTISNSITNNNQLTNGAGFITGLDWTELGGDQADINISGFNNDAGFTSNVGDITGVTAGSGLSGSGTSGTVTVSHADTST